jgi:hypothetical protein
MTPFVTAQRSEQGTDKTALRRIRVDVPEAELTEMRRRINATRWPEKETIAGLSQGVPLEIIKEVACYWATDYDWRKVEKRLNSLPQFITEIDGLDIHFIHKCSKHENALPVIVTHAYSDQPGQRFQSDVGSESGALGHLLGAKRRSDGQVVVGWSLESSPFFFRIDGPLSQTT